MKKILILTVVLLSLTACEKNEWKVDSLNELKSELNQLVESDLTYSFEMSPASPVNHFDSWGGDFVSGIKGAQDFYAKTESSEIPPLLILSKTLPIELNHELLTNLDLERIEILIDEVLKLFIKKDLNVAILLSFEMERIIIKTKDLRNNEKELMLKVISIIRHTTYYFNFIGNQGSKSEFDNCWRRKLLELQEAGIFTKLTCAFSWPICLGALALDCLVERID